MVAGANAVAGEISGICPPARNLASPPLRELNSGVASTKASPLLTARLIFDVIAVVMPRYGRNDCTLSGNGDGKFAGGGFGMRKRLLLARSPARPAAGPLIDWSHAMPMLSLSDFFISTICTFM